MQHTGRWQPRGPKTAHAPQFRRDLASPVLSQNDPGVSEANTEGRVPEIEIHFALAIDPSARWQAARHRAARAVEIDLPAAREASAAFTTLTLVAGLCCDHGREMV